MSAVVDAAARWLYAGDPGAPVWPPHDPYVVVRCRSPRRRHLVGAVYATPHGFVLVMLHRPAGRKFWLIARPGGSPILPGFSIGSARCGCRPRARWREDFGWLLDADALRAVLADVLAGRTARPGQFTMAPSPGDAAC